MCALAQDFSQKQDFPERKFLQRALRTSEEFLFGALFPQRLLQRSSESGEDCFDGVQKPRWSNLLPEKPVVPHVVSCDGKSCSWRNPVPKCTRLSTIFKKCIVKTTFKLKINLI
jgi:hypothetical protein